MRSITSAQAKNKFGELIETARSEPVVIKKNGRDQVVVLSVETYDALVSQNSKSSLVEELHRKSIERRRSVYEALAK